MGDFGILGTLHLVAWIYALIQIFGSSAKTNEKVLWAVIVGLLPLAGLIVWFFIGPGTPKK
jgi:hypothetical protein